jgi:phage gp29-like protein
MPKNIDRNSYNVADDLEPIIVNSIFQSANGGSTRRQSRLASDLLEKDPAMSQAWSVRVASIASCPFEILGSDKTKNEFIKNSLMRIQPNYETGLVGFKELLQNLQSAVMHGFTVAETEWSNGGSKIDGFKLYNQSLFSYSNGAVIPYYCNEGIEQKIKYPRWIYHTATNSRDREPLRSGLVRPLAYLYSFRRHVQIQYLRGIEKFSIPFAWANVPDDLYEDSEQRDNLEAMLANWTYDGYAISNSDVELTFPTANANFNEDIFLSYLNYTEKQIFRLILGQDSTSSADNSNRSTAQVHNLVRQDLLHADALAVEETVNNQIIKPLMFATYGEDLTDMPRFNFILKGVEDAQAQADVIKTLSDAGLEVNALELSERLGFRVFKKDFQGEVNND